MATPKLKADIVKDIDRIIFPQGNIKATDTNTILKDMLDCIELNEKSESNVDLFDISETNLKATQGALLNYSFRGIRSSFVNVTLHLRIKENSLSATYEFEYTNSKLFGIYKGIVAPKEAPLDFLVTLNHKSVEGTPPFGIATLNIVSITNQVITIKLTAYHGDKITVGDTVFTSFTLHCPGFNQ